MKWLSKKSWALFLTVVLLLTTISLALMPSPAIAQEDEKSKELTFTETDSYYIDNDYIQIKFINKRPFVEWYSKETSDNHKLSLSIRELVEFFDTNPNEVYDGEDTIYRNFRFDDPNLLFGKKYEITKNIKKDRVTLTFRARGDILDTSGNEVGFADVSFVFKIFASDSGAAVYAPSDGIEMAIEVIVTEWSRESGSNFISLNTSLRMQSGDSATLNGKTIQTTTTYEKISPSDINSISVYNSSNIQMGYMRLATRDNQDTIENYSYKASETKIVIMSTYLNIGKTSIHQMSIGVPESLSTVTDQGQGIWDFGGIISIFQGFPNILENILLLEIIVVVAVLAVVVVFLLRRRGM